MFYAHHIMEMHPLTALTSGNSVMIAKHIRDVGADEEYTRLSAEGN